MAALLVYRPRGLRGRAAYVRAVVCRGPGHPKAEPEDSRRLKYGPHAPHSSSSSAYCWNCGCSGFFPTTIASVGGSRPGT
jgi:hypothetical protein